ncbi:MAG: YjiH family protein [Lachnospiraceae bacterium]|nr:YjiH family protein [Lachnospiraceae bacterium]
MKDISNKGKSKAILLLKFLLPSLIGIVLFMFPVTADGKVTIPIAILSSAIQKFLQEEMALILVILVSISFLGAVIVKAGKRIWKNSRLWEKGLIKSLFDVSPVWFVARAVAFIFVIFTYLEKGTKAIYSADTGGLVFHDLLPILFTIFFLAGLFLPLLLNFGLLEFTGTLLIKVMRPVFGLPGRSAVDAIASWLGDGTIGVLLTSKQYEEGFYTEKEACIIGTNFSLVSITFSLVVVNTVGLSHLFIPFYLTITFACIIAAIIIPKLPPLSRKKNLLVDGSKPDVNEDIPKNMTGASYGLSLALDKVKDVKIFKAIFVDGAVNVLDMWISVIPIVMAIGTTALILAEYTPIFRILGIPFMPLLSLLQIPEAAAASQTLFAGFADMLLPSVMIANVSSDLTRFVVAAVSVSQLIYLSEVGALLLASKIPVKLSELFLIFIERTLITLPIIALIAHMIF